MSETPRTEELLPTPRTDAALRSKEATYLADAHPIIVDLARTLERELAALRAPHPDEAVEGALRKFEVARLRVNERRTDKYGEEILCQAGEILAARRAAKKASKQ